MRVTNCHDDGSIAMPLPHPPHPLQPAALDEGQDGKEGGRGFLRDVEFLKKRSYARTKKRELRIAGMSRFDDLDEYEDLVVRTREELSAMIRADNNDTIVSYLGLA